MLAEPRRRSGPLALIAAAAVVVIIGLVVAFGGDERHGLDIVDESEVTTTSTSVAPPTTEPVEAGQGPLTFTRVAAPPFERSGRAVGFVEQHYAVASDGGVWRTDDGLAWSAVTDLDDLGPPGWESNWRQISSADSLLVAVGAPTSSWSASHETLCWSPGHDLMDVAVSDDAGAWSLASVVVPESVVEATELGGCVPAPMVDVAPVDDGGFVMTAVFFVGFDELTYAARVLSVQEPGRVLDPPNDVDPATPLERRSMLVDGTLVAVDLSGFADAQQQFRDLVALETIGSEAQLAVNFASDDGRTWREDPTISPIEPGRSAFDIPADIASQGGWYDLGTLGLLNVDLDDDEGVVSMTLVNESGRTTWTPDVDVAGPWFGNGPFLLRDELAVFAFDDMELVLVRPS